MVVSVTGSSKSKREMAEDIAHFSLGILAPRLGAKLEIDIVLINNLRNKEGIAGDCTWEDRSYRPREFTIRIDSSQSKQELLETIAHEMVHVKQFARGELNDTNSLHISKWNDKEVDDIKTNYYDLPWEIEAHEIGRAHV